MLRHVGECLLGHAVDRGLHHLGQLVGLALGVQPHLDPRARGEALELRLHRGQQPVVVERRGPQLAGEVEQLLHRLVHQLLELGHLRSALRRGVLGERLEAQQDRGEGLVDLVVQVARQATALLLLGAHRELARAPALLLDALEQALEGVREAIDLLDRVMGDHQRGGLGGIDRLDPVDQVLERPEAALEHPEVHAEREDDRQREDAERPALVAHVEVEPRGQAGREQGQCDQQDVRRNDLAYEGIVAARHPRLYGSECAHGGQMGSSPHIGRSPSGRKSW